MKLVPAAWLGLLLLLIPPRVLAAKVRASTQEGGRGYLLVSSPSRGVVHYARLLSAAEEGRGERLQLHYLTTRGQLKRPHGLAVDSFRRVVYVADTGAKAIVAIRLLEGNMAHDEGGLSADDPITILQGIDAEWVTVDATGALLCTNTVGTSVWVLSSEDVSRRLDTYSNSGSPKELFPAAVMSPLLEPRGIAADALRAYWVVADGSDDGAVLSGAADPGLDGVQEVRRVANVSGGVPFGLCLTGTRLFLTTQSGQVQSVKLNSEEPPVLVSDQLQRPRGCAYNGDGTVFVADEEAGRVYAFSGGAARLKKARPIWSVLEVPKAYGLAVLTSGTRRFSAAWSALVAVGFALSLVRPAL